MDIVEWLRQFKLSTSDSNYNALIVNGKIEEAADKIERLRMQEDILTTEVERLREVIANMTELSNNLFCIGFTALGKDE